MKTRLVKEHFAEKVEKAIAVAGCVAPMALRSWLFVSACGTGTPACALGVAVAQAP